MGSAEGSWVLLLTAGRRHTELFLVVPLRKGKNACYLGAVWPARMCRKYTHLCVVWLFELDLPGYVLLLSCAPCCTTRSVIRKMIQQPHQFALEKGKIFRLLKQKSKRVVSFPMGLLLACLFPMGNTVKWENQHLFRLLN